MGKKKNLAAVINTANTQGGNSLARLIVLRPLYVDAELKAKNPKSLQR
jgi:hypothetical protein